MSKTMMDLLVGWWNWLGKLPSWLWNLAFMCLMWMLWREWNSHNFNDLKLRNFS